MKYVAAFLILVLSAATCADESISHRPPRLPTAVLAALSYKPAHDHRFAQSLHIGTHAFNFEETPLSDIRKAIGIGELHRWGDASESEGWLCYTRETAQGNQRIWLSSSELSGDYFDGVIAEVMAPGTSADGSCPTLPNTLSAVFLDRGLWLGMSKANIERQLGGSLDASGPYQVLAQVERSRHGASEYRRIVLGFENGLASQLFIVRDTSD